MKQKHDYSCGAASLATLLTYGLGFAIEERKIVDDMFEALEGDEEALRRKEGFSLLDMQKVSESYGFQAQGFRIEPRFLEKLGGPVIVFIKPRGYEHFAVLRGITGDTVFLADPSRGNLKQPIDVFLENWLEDDDKGIIFVVEPTSGLVSTANKLVVNERERARPELLSIRRLVGMGLTRTLSNGVF